MENLETRVGFMAVDVLLQLCKEYIDLHTKDGKYFGNVSVLHKYKSHLKYLREDTK